MAQKEDYTELHKAMKALVEAQDKAGWQSPEIERLSRRIVLYLWTCANNNPVPEVILRGMREEMAELTKLKSDHAG